MPPKPRTPAPSQSGRFNAVDADVVFQSSDNVLFSIHRKNLETHTGAFPPAEFKADEQEVVTLQESSETLDLLFQFIYPQRHPSLSDSTFEVLAPLAEAAEKYEAYSAMNICHIRMLKFLEANQHAEHIMSYAAKHGYKEVVDVAAPLVISMSIGSVIQILPPHLHLSWVTVFASKFNLHMVLYREQWKDNLHSALMKLGANNTHKCGSGNCEILSKLMYSLNLRALTLPMKDLVKEAYKGYNCGYCNANKFDKWAKEIDEMRKTSYDDVLFAIHKKNHEMNTGAFPPAEFEGDEEPVHLTESSETLELLFQFIYSQRHPSLSDTSFEVLAALAEAAEKYEVFAAMNICHLRMLLFLEQEQYAERIMEYAAKHDYYEVCDSAAPLIISMSIERAAEILPPHLFLPWMLYRQQWQNRLQDITAGLAITTYQSCHASCMANYNLVKSLTLKTFDNPQETVLENFNGCGQCTAEKYFLWAEWVVSMKDLPVEPFRSFIV
ncbi:hypothetical protein BDQ17DRAFT_1337020 [Cyathus striatus]|nr:hypothetical protein BDQ17DRAFT_1337020 [Cyathus striatus]